MRKNCSAEYRSRKCYTVSLRTFYVKVGVIDEHVAQLELKRSGPTIYSVTVIR